MNWKRASLVGIFIAIFIYLGSSAVNAAATVPAEVSELAKSLNESMMICPQKIWPNYNWSGTRVVFIYNKNEKSWLWDPLKNRISEISNKKLSSQTLDSTFSFFKLDGIMTMTVSMAKGQLDAYHWATHEMFHKKGQENWVQSPISGRGTEYPVLASPRLYRYAMFAYMYTFLKTGRPPIALQYARFWFEKWKSEFPRDYQTSTDRFEGTAKYVETMAFAVKFAGCSPSSLELESEVNRMIAALDYGSSVGGDYFAVDYEGYDVGGLASLILRLGDHDLDSWTKRVEGGELPIEVLLDSVTSLKDDNLQLPTEKFEAMARETNQEIAALVDQDLINWKDNSYVRVQMPSDALQGNLLPTMFVWATAIQQNMVALRADHFFKSPRKNSKFILKKGKVLFSPKANPCATDSYFSLISKADMKLKNRIAEVSSELFVGQVEGNMRLDKNGMSYFCTE